MDAGAREQGSLKYTNAQELAFLAFIINFV